MNILCIGDVTGSVATDFLRSRLPALKRLKSVELVIANGENSADTNGITPDSAAALFDCGVDVITTGNHSFQRKESYDLYEENPRVIRPANYPDKAPGIGFCDVDMGRLKVRVINLLGIVDLPPLDCPFATAKKLVDESDAKIKIIDFHAEATGEKRALAFYLDGTVSAIFGTHTHVQTADAQVLPGGTGYITDVGMTGAVQSCLGVKSSAAIERMTTKMPTRLLYETEGEQMINAVLFEIDEKSGLCTGVERLDIR